MEKKAAVSIGLDKLEEAGMVSRANDYRDIVVAIATVRFFISSVFGSNCSDFRISEHDDVIVKIAPKSEPGFWLFYKS